jgi:hypothetical protein
VTAPLGKECLGRRLAGVQDLCPAMACGGGGNEGAAEGGGHAAEHRARLRPTGYRSTGGFRGFGRGTDTTVL